jgi:hypothetical protein
MAREWHAECCAEGLWLKHCAIQYAPICGSRIAQDYHISVTVRAIAQAVSRRLSTGSAWVRLKITNLWLRIWHLSRFSTSTTVSPANSNSVNYLMFINHPIIEAIDLQFLYCCVCISYSGNLFTKPLPSNDRLFCHHYFSFQVSSHIGFKKFYRDTQTAT